MGDLSQATGARQLNGGRVTGVPAHLVGLEESPGAENIDPSSHLGAKTRNGQTQEAADNGSVVTGAGALKHWKKNGGTTYLYHGYGSYLYYRDAGSWVEWYDIGDADTEYFFSPLGDKLVFVGSSFAPQQTTTGTLASSLQGSPPSAALFVALWKSKIWLAGDPSNPQMLTFSTSQNPEDYTTVDDAGSITIDSGGGDKIQGLMSTPDALIVMFRHRTEALFWDGGPVDNMFLQPILSKGLSSVRGWVSSEKVGFMATDDGVYAVNGRTVSLLTVKVKEDYDAIADKSQISLGVKDDKLYVTAADESFSLVLDFKRGVWSKYTNQQFRIYDLSVDNTLYAGANSASTTQVWKVDSGSTDGATAITAKWTTPDLDFGRHDLKKNIARYQLHVKPSMPTTTTTMFYDGASLASVHTHTFTTTGRHEYAQKAVPSSSPAGHLSLQFAWEGVGTAYGWTVYAIMRDDGVPFRDE